jgi:putative spermidine/putrescine transport system permease protein
VRKDSPGDGKLRSSWVWRPNAGSPIGILLLLPLAVASLALVGLPVIKLVVLALGHDAAGAIRRYVAVDANLYVLQITFRDSLIVALSCCVVGGMIAWSIRTTRSRVWRTALWAAVLAPLMMGTVVKNYAFVLILARHGPLNDLLVGLGLLDGPIQLLFTQAAIIMGIVYAMIPFAVLPLYVAFINVDLDLVAAAENLGSTRVQAIWSIVLPLVAPSLLASGVLVFVLASGFYVTPLVLGGARSPFAAPMIARALYEFNDIEAAALSSLVLIASALLVVGAGVLLVGRDRMRQALG